MGKKFILVLSLVFLTNFCYASSKNDLRTLFLNNRAKICGINIRNFNSQDLNGNEIIDSDEISGNFLNAIERLDEIKSLGINTLHVLPITPTGKLKALGTAGSLYAIADFENINEQFVDKTSELTSKEQVKKFIQECHNRGIRVIIDLPSCGSYDLFLKHPELFIKDDKNLSIVPSDWTDVRLLNAGIDENINQDLINTHKNFIDMILNMGADGVRADVATIKPYKFWEELIKYTREKDPEFLYLAEASDSWIEPPSQYAEFTPYDELLKAGFDGYYGSFFNLKKWNAEDLYEHIKFNNKLLKSYKEDKSVILSFTTHDEISPILMHGENFSIMICWLEAILPYNPYSIDGFAQGDDYLYKWTNTKAETTSTDDDTYFVHRGKLDIFNFSRKPMIKSHSVLENFKAAYKFRFDNEEIVTKGNFIPLKIQDKKIFAFIIDGGQENILALGNLDFKNDKSKITIKNSRINKNLKFNLIHGDNNIKIGRKKIETSLKAGEIKIIKF